MRARLVERANELERLHRLTRSLETGGGRVVLVRGEAGIGKTTLVTRFAEELEDVAEVLVGASDDLSTPQPLGPVRDIARRRPEVADALSSGDRTEVMRVLLDLLSRPWRPTVLVLEDTHWADDATLDLITFLGRRIESTNGLLVLTYRDGAIDRDHPMRRVVGGLPVDTVEHVRLEGFSAAAVRELADGRDVDSEQILRLTGGNPLFVSEILAGEGDAMPVSVRDAVRARVARLGPEAWNLAQFVALVPGGLTWSLVERLGAGSTRAVQEAVGHGLLEVGLERVVFRHELQRRAVEGMLPPTEVRRRHGDVLAALGDDAEPARLAHHAAGAGDVTALLRHAHRAAREASAASSHHQALDHYRSMAPHIGLLPEEVAADVVDEWGHAATHQGDPASAEIVQHAVSLRRRVGEPLALQRTLAFGAFVLSRGGHTDLALSWGREAVAIAEEHDARGGLARAHAELARLHLTAGDVQAGRAAARRAIELGEELGDARVVASAMTRDGMFLDRLGDETGIEVIAAARRRARAAGHAFEEGDALLLGAVAKANRHADLDDVLDDLEAGIELAVEHEQDGLAAFSRGIMAEVHVWTGQWALAEEEATSILTSASPHDAVVLASRVLAVLAVRRGRGDVDDALARMWQDSDRLDHRFGHQGAAAATAEHVWTSGLDESEWAHRLADAPALLEGTELIHRDELAHWLHAIGRVPSRPTFVSEGYRALADGRPSAAAAVWDDRGMPYHRAVALVRGDQEDVVAGLQLLDGLGADATAARVRSDLRDRGETVPRRRSQAARQNPAGLTARQLEVLDRLARGLTNAEIADALFISQRTAEHHVAAVLRALDVGDRRAAVEMAAEMGLLDEP